VDRRTLAVDFDDYAGVTIVDATREAGDAVAGPGMLWFHAADLAGAVRVEAEVSYHGESPACLEFRAGDRLLAEITVPVTGGRYAWTTVTATLPTPPTGVHDLEVTLHGDFRLAAFRFESGG
jgi:beta-glucosidase